MISSQRLILIVLFVDLLMGLGISMYRLDAPDSFVAISSDASYLANTTEEFKGQDPYSGIKNANLQLETTAGNSIQSSGLIYGTLVNGLNPFSITPKDVDTRLEKGIVIALIYLRGIINLIAILEIILILKNKKST